MVIWLTPLPPQLSTLHLIYPVEPSNHFYSPVKLSWNVYRSVYCGSQQPERQGLENEVFIQSSQRMMIEQNETWLRPMLYGSGLYLATEWVATLYSNLGSSKYAQGLKIYAHVKN